MPGSDVHFVGMYNFKWSGVSFPGGTSASFIPSSGIPILSWFRGLAKAVPSSGSSGGHFGLKWMLMPFYPRRDLLSLA